MFAMVGMLLGPLFLLGSGILLFWNEGRAVQTERSLAEGRAQVVAVDPTRVEAANEGKLVHIAGDVKAAAPLRDPEFDVSASGLRLVRTVEMFQWKEERRSGSNTGNADEASYQLTWNAGRIDSSRFRRPGGHENPQMRYSRASFTAGDAALGAFRPGERALGLLPASQTIRVTPALADTLRGRIGSPLQAIDGRLYLAADPGQPRLGDLRISFTVAPNGPASFIGRQSGADLVEYQTRSGDRLLIARSGRVDASEMFQSAEQQNRTWTWLLRIAGLVVMLFGFVLLMVPLSTLTAFIPFIGGLARAALALLAAALTVLLGSVIIAVAWLWYRPLVSIVVLVVGAGAAFGLRRLATRKSPPVVAV